MNNFEFYNPVKILFGKDQISKTSYEVPKGAKVLLVYGSGSIKKNGVYDKVTESLKDFDVIEFSGITANPQYDTLMEAVLLARKEKINFILAVGGGSIIDGCKFISAAINHQSDPWFILSKRESFESAIPFGCILTLPATGSEMNCFSVVSKGEEKLGFGNPKLFPKFAILDPEVTFSLPERQLGNGIVDAFVHVAEQYITKDINTPIQDRFSEGIMKTLIEEAPKVMEIKDYASRANLMWGATMALNGLIGSGVVHDWATHMIGHEITALYGIDHARTLALVYPSLLRFEKQNKKEKLLMFAKNVWGINDNSLTNDQKIEEAINRTEDLFNSVGVPTKLVAYNIGEEDIQKIASAVKSHHNYSLGENKDISEEEIKTILKGAL